jgi:hypothetical protein
VILPFPPFLFQKMYRRGEIAMSRKKKFHGSTIYKFVQMKIITVNALLKEAGFRNAKVLCRSEDPSHPNCLCSTVVEDATTPFTVTLGNALGVKVVAIRWTAGLGYVEIVYE